MPMPTKKLAVAASALLLDCASAFTGLPPVAARGLRPTRAVEPVRPAARPGDALIASAAPHGDEQAPGRRLRGLPGHVSDAITGLPQGMWNRLSDIASAKRMEDKRGRRAVLEEQAEVGSSLVCKIYFQSIKDNNQYGDQRLSRTYQDDTEKAHNAHRHRHRHPNPDRNLVLRITKTIRGSNPRPSAPKAPNGSSSDSNAQPQTALVHESVSATLELVGIQNRIDFTKHDGLQYMDVVVDAQEGDSVRGLVIQIITPGHRQSYVDIKTAALREDGWAVITVKAGDWARKQTTHARASWLARKLVKSGYWMRQSADTCDIATLNA
jgi:hypothetical protein